MIIKNRKKTIKIKKLEASLRRLPIQHPRRPDVQSELAKRMAGYNGEGSLDYELSFLSEKDFLILHDIRLKYKDFHFQIDTLILSPHFFLIIEVKNISGTLIFDQTFNQLIRIQKGSEEAFPDPILQVNHQRFQFTEWTKAIGYPLPPIEAIVVITSPYTIIKSASGLELPQVIRKINLISKIDSLKEIHTQPCLTKNTINEFSQLILEKHTPSNSDVLKHYQIQQSDLRTGVHCPECHAIPMTRKWGYWLCSECAFSSEDAHLDSLNDYYLLFKRTITNKEFRDFTKVQSPSVANKLLRSINLKSTGKTKTKKYILDFDNELKSM